MRSSNNVYKLEASFSISRTRQQPINAENKNSNIFSMQLKVIPFKMFDRQTLRLQDKSPHASIHRQMGEDEEVPSATSLERLRRLQEIII